MGPVEKASVLGVPATAGTLASVAASILQLAADRTRGWVCVANVDMVTRARRDAGLYEIMRQAALVATDGMPLVWLLKRQGFAWAQRVYGPDLMAELCRLSEQAGIGIYLYGGTAFELEALVNALRTRFPRLSILGAESPPLLPPHPPFDVTTADRISASGARLVFVSLGCPKQEYWMSTHAQRIDGMLVGVGLAFAQLGGVVPRAPGWMQRRGLEWLFRLAVEPRRLFKRYLVANSLFLWFCVQEFFGYHDRRGQA